MNNSRLSVTSIFAGLGLLLFVAGILIWFSLLALSIWEGRGAPAPAAMVRAAAVPIFTSSPSPTRLPTGSPSPSPPTATPTPSATATALPTATPLPSPTPIVHIVRAGQTLEAIAAHYSARPVEIMQANNLIDPARIETGQSLLVPLPDNPGLNAPLRQTAPYRHRVIGTSAGGRTLELYSFGDGPVEILFAGGIHGGLEWNTVILAYQALDYFHAQPEMVPDSVTLHIVPVANPDGLFRATGKEGRFNEADLRGDLREARFNENGVDLNRNWSCNWEPAAVWNQRAVDPGSAPFSEPETRALRDLVLELSPAAVVFWHSVWGIVVPGECEPGHQAAVELAHVYAEATGYRVQGFGSYRVTGGASDWLTARGIAGVTVELRDHRGVDWEGHRAAMLAVLTHYAAPLGSNYQPDPDTHWRQR